ncbi:hypothetical protein PWT90_00075 [Aphanocladium album]|nr:hypothetical protein PWT90_00075 [Aphanocladium album]
MHQSTMRLVGLAAALLAATTTAVPVDCGAIDALWEEQTAVVGMFPECESYYDNTNLEQRADVPENHPHLGDLALCSRNVGPGTYKCPGGAKRNQAPRPSVACRRAIGDVNYKCRRGAPESEEPVVRKDGQADKRVPPVIGNKPPIFDQADVLEKRSRPGIGNKPPIFDAPPENESPAPKSDEAIPDGQFTLASRNEDKPPGVGNKPPIFDAAPENESPATETDDAGRCGRLGCGVVGNKPPVFTGIDSRSDEKREKTGNWPPHDKRDTQEKGGNWPPHKRDTQEKGGNWPPHKRDTQEKGGNWPPQTHRGN